MSFDVIIVGGSVAGSGLAIELGRRGVRTALYEKARHPRLKPCGEGLLPHGVRALREIAGLPDAPRVRGLRFVAGDVSVAADFPEGFGLVVRRDRFDAWLFAKAASTPNVTVFEGVAWTGEPHAPMIVGADGAKSQFHRRGFDATPARPARVGQSTHVAGLSDLSDRVEVFFHDEGELYLAPTGGGEALVAGLFNQSRFRPDGVRRLLAAIPELRERSARIEFTTPVLSAAPLGLRVKPVTGKGALLIGDAAGAPDPITGDGMALALCSVAPAADAIVSGDLTRYAKQRLSTGRTAERLGKLLLRLGGDEARAARTLRRRGDMIPALLEVAVGRRPLTALTLLRAIL